MLSEWPAGETPAALTPHEAREQLAQEWRAANPTTPDEIAALGKMCPSSTLNNGEDCRGMDAVLPCEGLRSVCARSSLVFGSYGDHLIIRESGSALPVPASDLLGVMSHPVTVAAEMAISGSTLDLHVGHVVKMGTEPQVAESGSGDPTHDVNARLIVLEAGPYVAGVQDKEALWYIAAAGDHPCDMMNSQGVTALPDLAIAVTSDGASPESAVARLITALIKMGDEVWGKLRMHIEPPTRCAAPRGVTSTAGVFARLNFTTPDQIEGVA